MSEWLCLQNDKIYWSPAATEDEIYGQMSQNKYQELPRSSVHCKEALGEGEFGSVYRGEWQSPMGCVEVAVKVSKDGLDPSEKVKLLQEAAVMGQFLHPRVVRLFGVVTLGEPVSYVCIAVTTQYRDFASKLTAKFLPANNLSSYNSTYKNNY